jgi:drug/metabolite transporter (DMT)-like permease
MPRPDTTIPRTRRWGIGVAVITAVISGFAVYLNSFGVRSWTAAGTSSATYTTAKNFVATFALVALTAVLTRVGYRDHASVRDAARTTRRGRVVAGLVSIAVVGGSLPFLLFFEGLSRATSTQAAVLHKSLLVWVALLAVPLLGERLGPLHAAAIGLLVGGQLLIAGGFAGMEIGSGELMILAATILWAIETVIARVILREVPALTLAIVRMGAGGAILLAYGLATGALWQLSALGTTEWLWVLATGLVLSAYVATWYTSLARAPAVDVTAVLVLGAVVTVGLRSGVQGAALPSPLGLAMVGLGGALAIAAAVSTRSPVR